MVKQYELMVLLPSNFTPEQMKAFTAQVTKVLDAKKGKVVSFESLGKRQMAYRIQKQSEAFYVLFFLEMDSSVTQSFERELRLMDNVLRSLLMIKKENSKQPVKTDTIEKVEETKEE